MPRTRYEATLVARIPATTGPPDLTEVTGLKWSGVSYENEAGAPGRIDIGVPVGQLPEAAKLRLRDLIANPCELWIHRDDTRVAAGPLTSYTIQGRTITLYAPGLLGYLNYWALTDDATFDQVDQSTIVQTLIDAKQARTYGSFGLETSALSGTGVQRDLTVKGREGKGLLAVLQAMGSRENGFELSVDPTSRQIRLHSPRQGTDLSGGVYLDMRNVASPEVFASVAPGQVASDAFGTSSSVEGAALTSSIETASVQESFGRADIVRGWTDISQQATLDDHTRRLADDFSTMRLSVSPKLVPVEGADVDDFDAGDLVTYDYDSGLGPTTSVQRVRTKQVSISGGKAKEQLAVRFV